MRQRKQEVVEWAQEYHPTEWARVEERLRALPNATIEDALRDFEEQERLAIAGKERLRALAELAKLPAGPEKTKKGGGEEEGGGAVQPSER